MKVNVLHTAVDWQSTVTAGCTNSSNSLCSCPQSWQLSNLSSSCGSSVTSTFYTTFVYNPVLVLADSPVTITVLRSPVIVFFYFVILGRKGDWNYWISDLVKTLMKLIFNPCCEFRWSPEGPVSQIRSPHLHAGTPGIFQDLLKSVKILKSGVRKATESYRTEKSYQKNYHLSRNATLFPDFAVEDLPLDRTATLAAAFAVKELPLGRRL